MATNRPVLIRSSQPAVRRRTVKPRVHQSVHKYSDRPGLGAPPFDQRQPTGWVQACFF